MTNKKAKESRPRGIIQARCQFCGRITRFALPGEPEVPRPNEKGYPSPERRRA